MRLTNYALAVAAIATAATCWALASGQPALGQEPNPATDELGSVQGTIVVNSRIKSRGATSQKDIVLYLEAVKGDFEAPKDALVVAQKKREYHPHVLPVLVGTKVTFENQDSVLHNSLSTDDCCQVDFDLDEGQSKTVKLDKAGTAALVCRLHPEMSMYLVVLENPYFTSAAFERVEVDGKKVYRTTYSLEGLPPGEYQLKTWNKKLAAKSLPVVIRPGEATQLDITFD